MFSLQPHKSKFYKVTVGVWLWALWAGSMWFTYMASNYAGPEPGAQFPTQPESQHGPHHHGGFLREPSLWECYKRRRDAWPFVTWKSHSSSSSVVRASQRSFRPKGRENELQLSMKDVKKKMCGLALNLLTAATASRDATSHNIQ